MVSPWLFDLVGMDDSIPLGSLLVSGEGDLVLNFV